MLSKALPKNDKNDVLLRKKGLARMCRKRGTEKRNILMLDIGKGYNLGRNLPVLFI
jgi:hypothetical protein